MDRRIVPLIMCGGAGTRLWPASREIRPKQFLPLFGVRSTFQDTLLRVSDATLFERPIVITNAAYRFMVLEQLAEIGLEADILLEPIRRDSGPAIAAGAVFAEMRDNDAVVLALAADHVVRDTDAFIAACRQGLVAADAGRIVTFGVQPERAATEYGYISPGDVISGEVRSVAKFVEKPDPATAAEYIKAGYLWNSGNFMFRASVLLDEYRNVDAGKRAGRHRCRDQGRARSRICHARRGRIRIGEGDFDRLRGDGKDRACRRGAGGVRLVRCRLLACGVGIVGQGRPGQCRAGCCRIRGFPQLQRFDRQGAGGAGRRRRSGGGGDAGCRAGVAAEGCQRIEAAGGEAEDGRAAGHRGSPQGASSLGFVSVGRQWRTVTRSSASS